jgi:preprotein translocase subunit SecA
LINKAIAKIFGTSNEREIKRLMPGVAQINAFEPQIKQLTDEQLRAKTDEFRAKIQERIVKFEEAEHRQHALKEVLDEILPEAFAVCREASWRVLNMRHFDVQLIGGMVLHHGKIAEMKTGEGKTLVATLPVYLNALSGLGVHVVTVNDYLAKRDSEWMGKLYSFLGLSVGVIVHDLDDEQRREAYRADVTYGTNNEFGFDYLRDNMKFELRDCVQREFNFAIVDEVDSILIDEARTPLIISGASEESTDKYQRVNVIIPKLEKGEEIEGREPGDKILTGDFVIDEKHKTITVSDEGWEKVEKLLGIGNIADPENWDLKHHVEVAIKAHALYKRDVEYVVKDGEVIIVDEFTGRLMPGRRWSDGLHQAVEAKENVKVERENQTLATITFQNYFRLYKKLAGMTGTAETEAPEFDKIYKLEVVVIPTNRTLLRKENPDVVYRTEKEKFFAVADSIAELKEKQQPVLVGTVSIEKSERISKLLERKGIEHVVLNAKHHEREAEFVAQAGRLGRVTIATNMAGRGTDILLGGNAEFLAKQECVKKGIAQPVHEAGGEVTARPDDPTTVYWYYAGNEYICPKQQWDEVFAKHKAATDAEHAQVIAAGGLFILGTERHESRRIDNQLRGRAGRQGDPGASRFFLSLEDDLMRIFAKEWVSTLLQRLGMEEGVPIESKMISRRIEKAQEAVEGQNFEARKHLLEYDDVMNKQRKAVYGLRRQLLEGLDQKELIIEEYVTEILGELLDKFADKEKHPEDWDIAGLKDEIFTRFGVDILAEGVEAEKLNRVELGDQIFEKLKERYDAKEQLIGPDQMRHHERVIMLSVIDQLWKDHLLNMDHLKEGIGLRGYAQHDPLVEYKRESFDMFEEMMNTFKEQTVRYLYLMQIIDAATNRPVEFTRRPPQNVIESGPATSAEPQTSGNGHQPPPPQRKAATSLDDMERQFERKKRRELEQARMAGASMPDSIQQVVKGEKIGRNDPCHCGSGKKYKKCHGA